VELAHGGEARVPELGVHRRVPGTHAGGCLAARELEHRLAPGPEVAALRTAPERALERMAVRIDESRYLESFFHD
jgi:hypothetical protein